MYEHTYSNGEETDLVRIDKRKSTYYKPDHIIEIINVKDQTKKYWVLDSKYSKLATIQHNSLNQCMYKYILNTGLINNCYNKIENLSLLFPSGKTTSCINHTFFRPTVDLIVSKPENENDVSLFIDSIINNNIHSTFLKQKPT